MAGGENECQQLWYHILTAQIQGEVFPLTGVRRLLGKASDCLHLGHMLRKIGD